MVAFSETVITVESDSSEADYVEYPVRFVNTDRKLFCRFLCESVENRRSTIFYR